MAKKQKKARSPEADLALIRKKLGYYTAEQPVTLWLDTGSKKLNDVMGSGEKGLAYGKMFELFGPESHGKTLLGLLLAALAQADDAVVGWLDAENSFDADWARAQGLKTEALYLFQPKMICHAKSKESELQTAEELCSEAEAWMEMTHRRNPKAKVFLCVDSVTAFMVEEQAEAGLTEHTMRTDLGLARFLSRLCRRWVSLAFNYNAMIIFINQLRISPAQRFGNPEYTPGGKALKFYCSIRVRVRRVKTGRILKKGKMIGLKGLIKNLKNKTGGGSLEGAECGFKAFFYKDDWRFVSKSRIESEAT